MQNLNTHVYDALVEEPDYDIVLETELSDKDAESIGKTIFEHGSMEYQGQDQNGNIILGSVVNLKKINGSFFVYLKIDSVERA